MIKNVNIELDCEENKEEYLRNISYCEKAFLGFLNSKLTDLPFESVVLSLIIIDDEEIRAINKEHRGKDKGTDVLSFPLQENLRAGAYDTINADLFLGDILISKDTCLRQATENKIEYLDEFIHLLCHGFLHLGGYDHELSATEDKLMRELESDLVECISRIKKGS